VSSSEVADSAPSSGPAGLSPPARPWGQPRGRDALWLGGLLLVGALAGAGFFLLPPVGPLFHVCWFFSMASTVAFFGPLFSAVQELSPVGARSSLVAFTLLAINLLGVGPGSLITGAVGDHVSLAAGLLISVGVGVAGTVAFALAARRR
jgi:hypothetical protein